MKIQDIQVLTGPNYWSIRHKVIAARLDIGRFEELPSNKTDGLDVRLQELLPGLYDHFCSEGKPGGFLERVKSGTWIGHIVEHIALELQIMTGMTCGFGRTRSTEQKGVYNVVVEFEIARAGIYALESAVEIAEALANGMSYPVNEVIDKLKMIALEDRPGPSTMAIIKAAQNHGIPYIRLDGDSLVQLGYGKFQQRIEATLTDKTSNIAVDMASDKYRTKITLRNASIPVPPGVVVYEEAGLEKAIAETGFPLVIKPYNKNQGKGVMINITTYEAAMDAFRKAREFSEGVLVEKYIKGNDYRLLLVNFKFVAAAQRTPAMVTGDSTSTIRQLVELVNLNPLRGSDHENVLTRIILDQATEDLLRRDGITPDSVPQSGRKIFLKQTANLSMGGTAEDVTDYLHPQIIQMAERVARIIGLDICGIDMIAEDISKPLKESNASVIEVNAAPGFRMHIHPVKGKPRPVGDAVVQMLFPNNSTGRIPIAAITGTNGKTTTARLLAYIARMAGYNPGLTTTDGIFIGKEIIEEGDCSGPESTLKILTDRSVDYAVLECARGGILKSGLAFDQCDIGIVTNVGGDHLGMKGINSMEDLAAVKSVVAESVKADGLAILNENDEYAFKIAGSLKCAVALFSINPKSKRMIAHLNSGGIGAIFKDNQITLVNGHKTEFTEYAENIPLTFGGKAVFMIENILAALIAAYFSRIDSEIIRESLRSFEPDFEHTHGRMNIIRLKNFSCILDYAHNAHGVSAIGSFLKHIPASEKVGIITAPGDRRSSDIIEVGKISAEIFDKIIIRLDEDTRGRKAAEIIDLLHKGIKSSRNKNVSLEIIPKESEAISYALENALHGSLITIFAENIIQSSAIIHDFRRKEENQVYENVQSEPDYVLRLGKNNLYEYTKRKAGIFRK